MKIKMEVRCTMRFQFVVECDFSYSMESHGVLRLLSDPAGLGRYIPILGNLAGRVDQRSRCITVRMENNAMSSLVLFRMHEMKP